MSRWKSFARSFKKNVIGKKKYKAFAMLLFDREYRASINHLFFLTRGCTKSEIVRIDCRSLIPGHKVVYPAYALDLFSKTDELPPIRVVFDRVKQKYVVVDGNHRLPALLLRALASESKTIECELIS